MHPAPGAVGRPSFASLVSSVDLMTAKYIPCSRVQKGRQEIIEDLEGMVNVCGAAFYLNLALKVAAGGTYLIHWLWSRRKEKKCADPSHFLSRYIQSSISIGSMFSLSSSRWRFRTSISTCACSRYVIFSLSSHLQLRIPLFC